MTGELRSIQGRLKGRLSGKSKLSGFLTLPDTVGVDEYDGEYTVTPTNAEQVLLTEGLYMSGNVVVNPIPSNYGLITWTGSVLTVS